MNTNTVMHLFLRALLAFPTGFIGGSICGSFILSFEALIGRNGSTGCCYIGYWSPALIGLGIIYGGPLGFLFYPPGYAIFLSGLDRKTLLSISWKVAFYTIVGGCIGAAITTTPIFEPILLGLLGFYMGCYVYRRRANV